MLAGAIREVLATYGDNENVICYLITKEEVNDAMIHYYGDEYSPLSDEEYAQMADDFNNDDEVNQILDDNLAAEIGHIVEMRKAK